MLGVFSLSLLRLQTWISCFIWGNGTCNVDPLAGFVLDAKQETLARMFTVRQDHLYIETLQESVKHATTLGCC